MDVRRPRPACGSAGQALLAGLRAALALAPVNDDFEMSGTAVIETCPRPCRVAWRLSVTGACFIGGVDQRADLDALVAAAARVSLPLRCVTPRLKTRSPVESGFM